MTYNEFIKIISSNKEVQFVDCQVLVDYLLGNNPWYYFDDLYLLELNSPTAIFAFDDFKTGFMYFKPHHSDPTRFASYFVSDTPSQIEKYINLSTLPPKFSLNISFKIDEEMFVKKLLKRGYILEKKKFIDMRPDKMAEEDINYTSTIRLLSENDADLVRQFEKETESEYKFYSDIINNNNFYYLGVFEEDKLMAVASFIVRSIYSNKYKMCSPSSLYKKKDCLIDDTIIRALYAKAKNHCDSIGVRFKNIAIADNEFDGFSISKKAGMYPVRKYLKYKSV